MPRLLPILTAALCFGAVLVARPPGASACSCTPPLPPAQAADAAAAVFEGRVEAIESGDGQGTPVRVELHVVRRFKGETGERLTLTMAASSAACGYSFEVDRSYLVYADQRDGLWTTSLCSRTQPLASADEDLAVLGMGATPVDPTGPGATPDTPDDDTKEPPARGGCAGCTLRSAAPTSEAWPLALALLALWRRRRRSTTRA